MSAREGEECNQAAATALGLDAVLAFRLRDEPSPLNLVKVVRHKDDQQVLISVDEPGGPNAFWCGAHDVLH
jgi:hypothetical protein